MTEVPLLDHHAPLFRNEGSFTLHAVLINLTSGHGLDKEQWNALIGIVTAIVGNILISFALNLQRYAHIRLNREEKAWQESGRSSAIVRDQYAEQEGIAKKRSELNAKAQDSNNENGNVPDERTSLMNGKRRQSDVSENTIRPTQLDMDDGENTDDEDKHKKSYLKSPWWWVGIILMTIGEAGNFLAYGFAPASLVSPLGVVALISNCIIAPWLLKEKFRKRDGFGVLIAIGGVVTLVLSSNGQEKRMGPDDIWGEITRWEFELYLGLTTGAMLVLIWASEKYGDRTLLIDLGLVGLFGGYTALSTKGIASLLSGTLWKAVTFPITYLLVAILVGTALMQIRYLNRALSRFDSTQVIPTQFVMFTISVILGSAVLYRDFESADAERVGKFVGGCALTFFGVYLITSGRHSNDGTKDDQMDEDVEEGIGLIDEEAIDEDEVVHEDRFSASSKSGRTSSRRASKSGVLERMISNASQQSQPATPSSAGLGGSYSDNPWLDSPREPPYRQSSNYTSTSRNTDTSDGLPRTTSNTPVRRNFLTATPEQHSRHRRSIVDLFPGPISTPLSSSLSGVIADRRRELEATSAKLRRGLGLRKSKSSRLRTAESSNEGNGLQRNPPSAPVLTVEEMESAIAREEALDDTPSNHSRSRSLSLGESLGSLLKGGALRKKTKPENSSSAGPNNDS